MWTNTGSRRPRLIVATVATSALLLAAPVARPAAAQVPVPTAPVVLLPKKIEKLSPYLPQSEQATDGWRAYTGANPHTNHVHFSFSWAGAMRRTSFWTGKVAKTDYGPCPRKGGPAPKYNGPNFKRCRS